MAQRVDGSFNLVPGMLLYFESKYEGMSMIEVLEPVGAGKFKYRWVVNDNSLEDAIESNARIGKTDWISNYLHDWFLLEMS